jgi:glycosyltransferase involved in cell wall biosynthesis
MLGPPIRKRPVVSSGGRLKVLTFTTLFPNPVQPVHGVFIKNRVQKMAALCDLTVVAPVNAAQNPWSVRRVPKEEHPGGLAVHHPRFGVIPGLFKHWDGDLLFRQTVGYMRRTLALDAYDILDVHYAYPDGVAGQRLAQEMRRPFTVSLRGSDINVLARFPRRRLLIQDMLGKAAAIIAVSKALGLEAAALGADPGKIHVIPNGVERSLFYPRERQEARRQLGWPMDTPILLSVGRLVSIKGFGLLIQVVNELRKRVTQAVRCYIVGEGELRTSLEKEIVKLGLEGHVVLPGRVSPEDLPLWYSASDLFCLLSHDEGCPNVVLESLACGTPVIATDVGGLPEMVRDGASGILVKRRDAEEVAGLITRALKMTWEPRALANSEAVRDWSDVARAHVEVLEGVVR